VTPSVAAPGDTHPSDATGMRDNRLVKILIFERMNCKSVTKRQSLDDIMDWCDMELDKMVELTQSAVLGERLSRVLETSGK